LPAVEAASTFLATLLSTAASLLSYEETLNVTGAIKRGKSVIKAVE
jgi:hypothetical protein